MARTFLCPDTEEQCNHPDCRVGFCAADQAAKRRAAMAPISPEMEEERRLISKATTQIVEDYLKKKRVTATPELIAKLEADPKVREMARQRVREIRDLL
ncbi:hypothetical protein [uncultured Methylobacterium sp.]|uniref:hypothetical protein n=1 Tax=uncultured Methylobacterium sp. TaxID=157278 RepID=UPI0035CC268F